MQKLIDNSHIKKIVEIGFGDYSFARRLNIPEGKQYIGYEVTEALMQKNTSQREFRLIDGIHDMHESGDLLITKEVIHHWPNSEIKYYLETVVPQF